MRQQHGPAFGPYYQTDVDVTVMKRQLLSGAFPGVPTAAPVATSPEDAADFWSPPKPLRGLLPLADGPSRTRTWTWTPEVPCQARGLQPRRTSNFRWINESSMGIVRLSLTGLPTNLSFWTGARAAGGPKTLCHSSQVITNQILASFRTVIPSNQ